MLNFDWLENSQMRFLYSSLVRMYISVGQQADQHLEELDFLLNQQPFKHSSSSQQKLQNSESNQISAKVEIRPDFHREQRKGVPEVIFGETKNIGQIVS